MSPATKLPSDIGPIHFIGAGGIGMSGIAEVLLNMGYAVQGSDLKPSDNTRRLERLGARVFEGQRPENLLGAEVVVASSAIKGDNPELAEARRLGLPVVARAEMLAELMRLKSNVAVAGTHGKTTTTTMVATLLEAGGIDPTVINGGIIHAYGSNARVGEGDWMVVEADESDGSFVKLPATIAIVTNMDPEHLEHYGSMDSVRAAFETFVENLPFYGVAVCCADHPEVRRLAGKITDRRVITYGLSPDAQARALNVRSEGCGSLFDAALPDGAVIDNCFLPMPGEHNVLNALSAIAVARHLGMKKGEIREALAGFKGVNRRFTKVGSVRGVTIVDDYAHHPVEISAVLKAARQTTGGRVIAVHQPHRYSRLSRLFEDFCECFGGADLVGITDIYPAGEAPIAGVTGEALVDGLRKRGLDRAFSVSGEEGLCDLVRDEARSGDLVVCMGAGTISSWARALPERLSR